jgi:hypothetical protein
MNRCCVPNCLEKQAILFKILSLLFTLENRGVLPKIVECPEGGFHFLSYLEN